MGDESHRWEPRRELLAAAHATGFKLSDPQLGRLHRAGLLQSPRTRGLGRGKGTASEFPPGSTGRLLRILQIQKQAGTQKFSTIAWLLWWEDGGQLSPPARELIRDVGTRWDRERDELAHLLAREEAGEPDAEQAVETIYVAGEQARIEGPQATLRRNTGREGFSSVLRVLAETATGRFESYGDHEPLAEDGTPGPGTTGALVERALGLDHTRADRIAGREPRFAGSSEAQLTSLANLIGRRELGMLATATPDARLDEARSEIRSLLELISTFAPMVERTLGGDASGYRTIARALNVRTPRLQASMLLAWLGLRQDPQLLHGMRDLIGRLPQALAAAEIERLSHELAKQVPALEAAVRMAARANLRGEREESARWRDEIKRVSDEHREEVDGFFAQHPEVMQLIATAER